MQEEHRRGAGVGGGSGAMPFHHLLQPQSAAAAASSSSSGMHVQQQSLSLSHSQPSRQQQQQLGNPALFSVSASMPEEPVAQLSMPWTLDTPPIALVTVAPSINANANANANTNTNTKPPPVSSPNRSTDARKLAAMTRSPMACVPCRDAKHKCDGSPPPALLAITAGTQQSRMDCLPVQADKRCSRCCSHGLECGWLPRAKLGRPLKRPRAAGAAGKGGANGKVSHDKAANASLVALTSNDVAKTINGNGGSPIINNNGNGIDGAALSGAPAAVISPPLQAQAQANAHAQAQSQPPQHPAAFPVRGIVADMVTLPLETLYSAASATVNDHAVNDAIQTSIADAYQGGAYSSTTTSNYPFAAFSDRTSTPANMPMPLITTDVSTQSSIRTGLKSFFTHGPRFCLAFVPAQEERFLRCLDRWSGILLNPSASEDDGGAASMYGGVNFKPQPQQRRPPTEARYALTLAQLAACIGWKLFRHDYARSIHSGLLQAGRVGLREIMARPLPVSASASGIVGEDVQAQHNSAHGPPNWQQVAYSLQALLLGCTIEYGLDHVPRAGELLDRATAIVLALDLNHFDANAGTAFSGPAPPPMHRLSSHVVPSDLADDYRRIFWELCVIQTMFNTSTTGDARTCFLNPQSDLQLGPIEINFPGGDSQSGISDYGLRIRAASLLLESVQPAPPGPSRMPRMQSLKTMLTNLAVYARHRFVTAETEQGLEVAYTACLMLNAAKVQLVRLTFFPAWNYALKSCSFEVGGRASAAAAASNNNNNNSSSNGHQASQATQSTSQAANTTASAPRARCVTLHWPKEAIRRAILDIVVAADDITELTEMDNKPRWPSRHAHSWDPPQTSLLSHSPFHACPQVIASFGYRAAATLYKDLAESAATPGSWVADEARVEVADAATATAMALSPTDGGGDDTTTTSTTESDSTRPSSARSMQERLKDALWRHRAVLSNMSLAHSALVSASALWPIASRLAAEVDNCRRSVDHDGPLSVTIEEVRVGASSSEGGGQAAFAPPQTQQAQPQPQHHDINTNTSATTNMIVEGGPHDVSAGASTSASASANGDLRNWFF